jgi:ribosomal protein S18 acetylase RimI-like enzyme
VVSSGGAGGPGPLGPELTGPALTGPRRPGHLRRIGRGPLSGATIRVRPAQPEDEEPCSALLRAIWAEGEAFLAHPDEAPDRVLPPVDPTGPAAFVAEVDGAIRGVALARPAGLRRLAHCRTLELAVDAPARGGGVGGALLDAVIDSLRARPPVRVLRLAVFADNSAAVGLYRSRGFVDEGRRVGWAQEEDGALRDDLLMRLALRPG